MWKNKASLLLGLKEQGIADAADTTSAEYKKLLQIHRSWWELLRLLKQSKLAAGLGLDVPREFTEPSTELIVRKTPRKRGRCHREGINPALGMSSNGLPDQSQFSQANARDETPTRRVADEMAGKLEAQLTPPLHSGEASTDDEGVQTPLSPSRLELSPGPPTKRRKVVEQEEDGDDTYFYRPLTPQTSDSEVEELDWTSPRNLQCHSQLRLHLHCLESKVQDLQLDEVNALNGLLEAILDLQETKYMARVVGTLSEKIEVSVFG